MCKQKIIHFGRGPRPYTKAPREMTTNPLIPNSLKCIFLNLPSRFAKYSSHSKPFAKKSLYMKLCLICSYFPFFRFSNGFVMLCQSEESGCFKA